MIPPSRGLPSHQREVLERWLPGAAIVRDLGWGLVDRHVPADLLRCR